MLPELQRTMKSSRLLPLLAVVIPILAGLWGCASVPVTGRNSLNLVSDEEVTKMSIEAFNDMRKTLKVSTNKAQRDMVERVGSRLADVVFWDVPNAEWEFVVFNAPGEVNAFAMAGGKVGVFSGVLDLVKSDDELAVVLAHEIAHVAARHVHEKLSQDMLVQAGGMGLAVATGYGSLTSTAVSQVYQMGSGMYGLSFDRGKESEADHIGLIYMARAGYNPRAAISLWERMDQDVAGKDVPPEWLSTHPSHENRVLQLYGWMEEAEGVYQRSKRNQN
jgi:metalloendopeptidase OMA1, mitochondrial